jgi:hypothetical protein
VIRGESKVTRAHLERTAIVYVRQSTLVQVREHTESTARQYDLAGQAARLGWAGTDIEVIDADLGLSGRSATRRDGFKQLVARVCLGEVGAVFGLEVSRLARSNADLARLLELARLTATLVIDGDGVYEPSDINDRLLPQLSDLDQFLRREWPGHVVDDASSTWRRRRRRAAGSVSRSGVGGVPAQREQLTVGGRELGPGLGEFAAQLGQPGRKGGDDAGGGVVAGFTG